MDWLILFFIIDFLLAILIGLFITKRIKEWKTARRKEVASLITASKPIAKAFNPAEVTSLPRPVRRYLQKTVAAGANYIHNTHLKQSGKMRFNDRWINLDADQYYSTLPPGFIWNAKMKLGPAWISDRDCYVGGKGNMLIKILSALQLFNVKGQEMDHASIIRYLSELPWLPTALLANNINWETIDNHSAKATITDGKLNASGIFYFNDDDEIIGFSTPKRYRSDSGRMEAWSGRFSNYRQFGYYLIPTKATAIWNAADGDFEYVRLNIKHAEFNITDAD